MNNKTIILVQEVEFKLTKNSPYRKAIGIFHMESDTLPDINFNNTPCTIIPSASLFDKVNPTTYYFHPRLSGSVYGVRMENERIGVRAIFTLTSAESDEMRQELNKLIGEEDE